MDLNRNQTWLISGDVSTLHPEGDLRGSLEFLDGNLCHILTELNRLGARDSVDILTYGPFLARSLLEVSLTALTGRLDPFRLLSIRRIQKSRDYDRQVPWKAAMRWKGDVVADKPSNAWTEKMEPKDMTRAALGDFYDVLLWQPALKRLSDHCESGVDGRWIPEILAKSAEGFCSEKRGSLNSLYSELSKAVHYEAVIPLAVLDRVTIVERINKCIREISELALVMAFMEHPVGKLDVDNALSAFREFETTEVIA